MGKFRELMRNISKTNMKVNPIHDPANGEAAELIYEDLQDYSKADLVHMVAEAMSQQDLDEFMEERT